MYDIDHQNVGFVRITNTTFHTSHLPIPPPRKSKPVSSDSLIASFALGDAQSNLAVSQNMMKAASIEDGPRGFPWWAGVFIGLGVLIIGGAGLGIYLYKRQRVDKVTFFHNRSIQLPIVAAAYGKVHFSKVLEVHNDDTNIQEYAANDTAEDNNLEQTYCNENSMAKFFNSNSKCTSKVIDELADYARPQSTFNSSTRSNMDLLQGVNDMNETELEVEMSPAQDKNEFIYYPKVSDSIDQAFADFMNNNFVEIPVFRISAGKYMIGTEIVNPVMKNGACLIKRQNAYEGIEIYLQRVSEQQKEKVQEMMDAESLNYAQAFKAILSKAFDKDQVKINRYALKFNNLTVKQSQLYHEPELLSSTRQRLCFSPSNSTGRDVTV